jgi:hypothetical protein
MGSRRVLAAKRHKDRKKRKAIRTPDFFHTEGTEGTEGATGEDGGSRVEKPG